MLGVMGYVLMVILLLVVVAAAFYVQKQAGAARSRIESSLDRLDVLRRDKATCHGRASKGERQGRALGVLALTPSELVFLEFVGDGELHIPRAAITGVEVTRGFLGKTLSADVLVVRWQADDLDDGTAVASDALDEEPEESAGAARSGIDGAAFEVDDLEAWRTALT
jgi:hypothetical protein